MMRMMALECIHEAKTRMDIIQLEPSAKTYMGIKFGPSICQGTIFYCQENLVLRYMYGGGKN